MLIGQILIQMKMRAHRCLGPTRKTYLAENGGRVVLIHKGPIWIMVNKLQVTQFMSKWRPFQLDNLRNLQPVTDH